MKRNILGKVVLCPEDYSDLVLREFQQQKHCTILPAKDTKKGVISTDNKLINKKGFYCIYKERNAVYVGYSNISIRSRLGRFFAAVRGTEHPDESHAGGRLYRGRFGTDFSELTVKVVEFDEEDLVVAKTIIMEDVELSLIYSLKPMFNSQLHKINGVSNA